MGNVSELIRFEADGTISFGDYSLLERAKLDGVEHEGDIYKIKTHAERTKFKRNGMLVYESVPGTAVHNLLATAEGITFTVEGPKDAQITVELAPETAYTITIGDGEPTPIKTNFGGKLNFSVMLEEAASIPVTIKQ